MYLGLKHTPVEPIYSLISFPFCIMTLYTPFNKHSPLKGHMIPSLQLQDFGVKLLLNMLWLWKFIMIFIFGMQLYSIFMFPLLNNLPNSLVLQKFNITNFRNSLPTLVFTELVDGGLRYFFLIQLQNSL